MTKSLIFATSNLNKIKEINQMLDDQLEIISMEAIGCTEDIPETSPTIEGNALQKARYVAEKYQVDCFAEDTGLEIEALNGEPGIYSARYAGPERDANANMQLALNKLQGLNNRKAQFRTVIALIMDGQEHTFEGIVEGNIAQGPTGDQGFGYDPIFIPDGYTISFAEMGASSKNAISHRSRALEKLKTFLKDS